MRFNHPVRANDIVAHTAFRFTPHDFETPSLSQEARVRLNRTVQLASPDYGRRAADRVAGRVSRLGRDERPVARIVSAGAVDLIDPTLRREFQTLSLRASTESGAIEWVVDGQRVGVSDSGERLEWPLTPGEHEILARDERGRTAQSSFLVK